MAGLVDIKGYDDFVVNICPDNTSGEVRVLADIYIQLPEQPNKSEILFSDLPEKEQKWSRLHVPRDLEAIKSMDEWSEQPKEFRQKYSPYIEKEFYRRQHGVWFMNNGVPTYITGAHYMMLQWSKIDASFYGQYLSFQRDLFIHAEACKIDSRCVGQLFVKCRRSGYTNISSAILLNEATQVKDKVLGIMSKTGKDAQENIFMKKVVGMYRHYPFFFKPIQDGTTNPRMELAFREPAKRITKKEQDRDIR